MSKIFRFIAAAIGAGVAGGFAVGAQAATLTLSDPNCSDFQMTNPSPGVYALSCSAIPQAPTCTLTPSTTSPVINANLTLTANCSQAPTSYAWTGCTPVASNSNTCTTTQASTGLASYSVIGTNGQGPSQPATAAVTWVSSITAPSGCSITPSSSSLAAGGGVVNLTASCGGGAATNFAWSGGGLSQSGPSNQASANIVATTTFSVVASNSAGPAPQASTTVTVATGTGGGGNISCAAEGYAATRVQPLTWSSTIGNVKINTTGFGPGVAVVVPFTTPALTSTRLGNFNVFETTGLATYRLVTLSSEACGRGTIYGRAEGTTAGVYFAVGGPVAGYQPLAPSTTYYLTIVNRYQGQETCSSTSCDAQVELSKPKGL